MSKTHQNGNVPASTNLVDVQEIQVEYDETTDGVTVTPATMNKGTAVCFKNPKGGKVRIAFVSPCGNETDSVLDSDSYILAIGGFYHFNCYFVFPGTTAETSAKSGGTLDVIPHRP